MRNGLTTMNRKALPRIVSVVPGEKSLTLLERYSIRLNRHSRESGNPGQPTCRLPWTPAFAGVTRNVSILADQALGIRPYVHPGRTRCMRHGLPHARRIGRGVLL